MPTASGELTVMVHAPWALEVVVPTTVFPPMSRSMVTLAGPVPVKVGVVTEVMLSVLDAPSSEAAVRSGVLGAARELLIVT